MSRIAFAVAAAALMVTGPGRAQDPQAVLDGLIRQQRENDGPRRHNERLRLELERRDLEDQLRYRRASTDAIMTEIRRYCPSGQPPCAQTPPAPLLQEAVRRGLIEYVQSARPGVECTTVSSGGLAVTDCD
jgi:hypothetical protein